MNDWTVDFQIITPSPALLRPTRLETATQTTPAYYNAGRNRPHEDLWIWVHTLTGLGIFQDAQGPHPVPENHSFLCLVSDPEISYYYPPGARDPWQLLWIGFVGKYAHELCRDLLHRYGPIYHLAIDHPVLENFIGYKNFDGLTQNLSPFAGAKLVTDLLFTLGDCGFANEENPAATRLIKQIQSIVQKNLDRPLTVADIARQLQLSREHLSRGFHQQMGCTLTHYINRQKIQLACSLFRQTALSSKQIAARLGYPHPAHFTRVFRRITRLTPSQFRANPHAPMLY